MQYFAIWSDLSAVLSDNHAPILFLVFAVSPWAFYPESVLGRMCVFLCGLPDRSLCQITRLVLKPDRPDYLSNQIVPDCSSSQIVQVISNARLRGSPDRQIARFARSPEWLQICGQGLRASPRKSFKGGLGITGVAPDINM